MAPLDPTRPRLRPGLAHDPTAYAPPTPKAVAHRLALAAERIAGLQRSISPDVRRARAEARLRAARETVERRVLERPPRG